MQQELELKALLALVAHIDACLQAVLGQRHAVYQAKVKRPCLARLLADSRTVQTEIELDGVGAERVFRGGLAQELPS